MGDSDSADLFAQLAVLLGGEDLGLAFNWVGNVEPALQLRLKAAQVGVIPVRSATEWASRLTAGWVYLAPGSGRGALPQLVEAMALGLPCIAVDSADHRSIIRHGENGYLCHTAEEIVTCIAPLIDSLELRLKIGRAAREDVAHRFGETKFREKLFAAYQLPLRPSRAA
jgi:glycosyltransferase involved in cell wall biosynthesis